MLISLSHRFVFIANLKSGSTAIENQLRRHAEVALTETRWGKHLTLAEVERQFPWVGRLVPRAEMFVWGVIRDPVDYVVSLYNAQRKPAFIGTPAYMGETPFAAFWRDYRDRPGFRWMFLPQSARFRGPDGALGVDYIVDYARLGEEWPALCARLGVPAVPLQRANPGAPGFGRADVPAAIVDEIYARYAEDVACLRDCTGRPLRAVA